MKAKVAVLAIVLAISLFYNVVQWTARANAQAKLISQNQSLENEVNDLKKILRQSAGPSPASPADIKIGKDILAIPQWLHNRKIQIIPYDKQLIDSGWVVIDWPTRLSFEVQNLDLELFYRRSENLEGTIYFIPSAKTCFNQEKQRLEIPVPRHLSSLSRLRFDHKSGISWNFSIEDSKLVLRQNS